MYYDVNYKTTQMYGIPFFDEQSLNTPFPQKKEEVKTCVENMVEKIRARASQMLERLERMPNV